VTMIIGMNGGGLASGKIVAYDDKLVKSGKPAIGTLLEFAGTTGSSG